MNGIFQYSLRWLIGVTAVFALILAVSAFAFNYFAHRVTVRNQGDSSIKGVAVLVRGNKYEIGEIMPHQSRTVIVRPKGESDVRIEYLDEVKKTCTIKVDCYLEPNTWPDTILVDVPKG